MREIKFRAWKDGLMLPWEMISPEGLANVLKKYPKTAILMQYTGFEDKNGREIYEGDWLKFVDGVHEIGCDCEHCYPCRMGEIVGVKWVSDGWMLLPSDQYNNGDEGPAQNFCPDCSARGRLYTPNHEIPIGYFCEVIGNIYENPELLNATNL